MSNIHSIVPRSRRPQAKIGQSAEVNYLDKIRSLLNDGGQLVQITTVAVNAASNSTLYTLTIALLDENGETILTEDVEYTSDASATIAEIGQGLTDAFNQNAIAGAYASAAWSSPTITITGRFPGQSFTITESEADLGTPVDTQAAATAEAIPFGRGVIGAGYSANVPGEACEIGRLPTSTRFTAQVITWDYTYNGGDIVNVTIRDKHTGRVIASVEYELAVSKTASTTAIAAALNQQLPANSVLAANAGAAGFELTLTAETAGFEFDVEFLEDAPATTLASTTYTTGPSRATSIIRAWRGISLYVFDEEDATVGGDDVSYPANVGFAAQYTGDIWVQSAQAITEGDDVYLETAAGTTLGRFYNTTSATRLLLQRGGKPFAEWKRDARATSGDSIAMLRLSD